MASGIAVIKCKRLRAMLLQMRQRSRHPALATKLEGHVRRRDDLPLSLDQELELPPSDPTTGSNATRHHVGAPQWTPETNRAGRADDRLAKSATSARTTRVKCRQTAAASQTILAKLKQSFENGGPRPDRVNTCAKSWRVPSELKTPLGLATERREWGVLVVAIGLEPMTPTV